MKISFGNYIYYPQINQQQFDSIKTNTVKAGDFVYNVADPPVNYFLRYEIKPNQIPNDKVRNSVNTFNRTQAEVYSMMYNPFWLAHRISHIDKNKQILPNIPNIMSKNS